MKNNKALGIVFYTIIFVIYSLLIFLIPLKHDSCFFVSYVFTLISYLMFGGVVLYNIKNNSELKEMFLGLPLINISFGYFIIQAILGILLSILPFKIKFVFIIQLLLLLIFLLFGISALVGFKKIKEHTNKIDKKVKFIKMMEADILSLLDDVTDEKLKKELENLAENIHYSDPMSNDSLSSIESKIQDEINELKSEINNVNRSFEICDSIDKLLKDRNRKCKILK